MTAEHDEMTILCDYCWEKIDQRFKEDGRYRMTLESGDEVHAECACEMFNRECTECGNYWEVDGDRSCQECGGTLRTVTPAELRAVLKPLPKTAGSKKRHT